uniref:Uncharacterized protein n=1 Tax=Arundo donax TaxID=35708 RepID=A0A0A9CNX3_ARUDO
MVALRPECGVHGLEQTRPFPSLLPPTRTRPPPTSSILVPMCTRPG